jgi:hypothetical protein
MKKTPKKSPKGNSKILSLLSHTSNPPSVRYNGLIIAFKSKRGWFTLDIREPSAVVTRKMAESLSKATKQAIMSRDDNTTAEKLRLTIGEYLTE